MRLHVLWSSQSRVDPAFGFIFRDGWREAELTKDLYASRTAPFLRLGGGNASHGKGGHKAWVCSSLKRSLQKKKLAEVLHSEGKCCKVARQMADGTEALLVWSNPVHSVCVCAWFLYMPLLFASACAPEQYSAISFPAGSFPGAECHGSELGDRHVA
jgi:hypothetical protein